MDLTWLFWITLGVAGIRINDRLCIGIEFTMNQVRSGVWRWYSLYVILIGLLHVGLVAGGPLTYFASSVIALREAASDIGTGEPTDWSMS